MAQRNHKTFKLSHAHVPYEYLVRLFHDSHDLHLPASREGPSDNLRPSFQMQFLQVLDREEQLAVFDVADDESFAARAELPLTTEVAAQDSPTVYIIRPGPSVRV